MDISRGTLGTIAALVYFAGGLLVLADSLAAPTEAAATAALSLHVAPVTALGLMLGKVIGVAVPFAFDWPNDPAWRVAMFLAALLACTLALRRILGGPKPARAVGDEYG